jgi:uncharacterized membrane protein YgdD (TMEM256/DUF423 family)
VLTVTACLTGFAAVALGAFGAHGLEGRLDERALGWWTTASTYLLVHAGAALAVGLSGRPGLIAAGGWCLALGAVLFASTLYAMALGAPRWLGAVTPLGGTVMLAGWALVAAGAVRSL